MQTILLKDGILVGAVGAYDWNGAVLKETRHGKVIPPKSAYMKEFPEELKNHGAYLGKKRFWLVLNDSMPQKLIYTHPQVQNYWLSCVEHKRNG